ncbi:hypothetical protein GCM10010912_39250 [Paenibacillus albidus]|uniref:Response regulator n=1 Tax=Paenibacillus albidus TaxID=2041023 RepID=A0A917FMW9_9BACL|nr:response regulator [Paenibacillus albidus]GGF90252.1 hypothetical protein GCM10010912_39250 [Paenibacillus albidus]
MQKVLLVDDEFIILDGISSVMNWASLGAELTGTAQNGFEALALVDKDPPDIVITDIRMPGMDGLALVAKVAALYPDISFIMLTGFSEFDYAKAAMQYGVRHYLLKPCSEESLGEALRELIVEREEQAGREAFFESVKYGLERVLPHAKEQFLKELVTNKTYGQQEWRYFGDLFGLHFQNRRVRLLLVEMEGEHEYEHLFAVRNLAADILQSLLLSTTVGGRVLLMMEDELAEAELFERINTLRGTFIDYYHTDITAALSDAGELAQVRRLYAQTVDCLNHRFYLGEGSLITEKDISVAGEDMDMGLQYDQERLVLLIKAGHWDEVERELAALLGLLLALKYDIAKTKSHLIQLFMEMIRLCGEEQMRAYMDQLPSILELKTLQSVQQAILTIAREITLERYERNRSKQSQMVLEVKHIVHRKYGDETLTLQTVANEIYMNPDYISKMFKKETGEKFTNYVMNYRMQKALEHMERGACSTVSALAEETGFGDNVSYFSKMFKKHTGCSPSEYNKAP